MISNKPYLVRAFNEWIVDCKCTPLLVVDATYPRCNVPQEYVENGEIILNIAPGAIRDLRMNNSLIEFKASFSGMAHLISVPMRAVMAIYAEENGQGMFFDLEEEGDEGAFDVMEEVVTDQFSTSSDSPPKKRSHLTLVE